MEWQQEQGQGQQQQQQQQQRDKVQYQNKRNKQEQEGRGKRQGFKDNVDADLGPMVVDSIANAAMCTTAFDCLELWVGCQQICPKS